MNEGLQRTQGHDTKTRWSYTQTFAVVMNKAKYEKLPADLKKIIDNKIGIETAALFGRAMDEGDAIGLDLAKKTGNNIVTLDTTETNRWQRAAAGVLFGTRKSHRKGLMVRSWPPLKLRN